MPLDVPADAVSFGALLLREAVADRTVYVLAGLLLTAALVALFAPRSRRVVRGLLLLSGLHALAVPLAATLGWTGSPLYTHAHFLALLLAAVALIRMAAALLFDVLLRRLSVAVSRISQDVLTGLASMVALFALASRAGVNVSGLVATSAVLTAVVGFALRDTLSNVIGGLSLQTDKSIGVGDWIKVGEVVGRVVDVRWRYTALETRAWETLIVPNSVLTTEKVMVLGRRRGEPLQWRRSVQFNVDFRHPPDEVMRVVLDALQSATIPGVAAEPPVQCLLMELHESYTRFAVRYWLADLFVDEATDSVVRTRVFAALRRADIPLSIPAHAVFLTEESAERKVEKTQRELSRRRAALETVDLLRPLPEEDRRTLAEELHYAPFGAGEVLTRQGAEAHWLYLVTAGQVSVRVAAEGDLEREVARLGAGDFFGEMSLMTGERRSATVVALTRVECYRLDKAAFQRVIERTPAVAEPMAEILARRRLELAAVKGDLDQEAQRRRLAAAKVDLLDRIREFFGLAEDTRRALR
jgi:small-conductance mechanosensitive channel/CRP-like cAMP-binding protein